MIFASFVFLFWFLPVFLGVYYATPRPLRNLAIVAGSLVFYGWWRPPYILLIFFAVVVDYICGRAMGPVGSGRARRRWLCVSIVSNLGLLAWFKYANLLVGTWNAVGPWPVAWQDILLPVGISFHTFQSISYTVDVYRGHVQPVRSFVDLLCFVSLFPQLVAGPIVRYRDIQDEMVSRRVDLLGFSDGVFLFAIGFAKKLLIADQVAPLANAAFGLQAPGLLAAWTGVTAYAVQIYFDFSGYSDMAIGLGRMLGFRFPSNFLSPYRAHSITDFWRRWHVSLSSWLRDYLYVPLGGNRRGEGRTYVNLALTMLLGGLWHGAAWTFLLWGAWQGAFLILERRLGKTSPYRALPPPLQVLVTFAIVLGGWAIFRAENLRELGAMWGGMIGLHGFGEAVDAGWRAGPAHVALGAGLFVAFALPRSEALVARFHPLVMLAAFGAFLLGVAHLLATDHVPFLYWRF